MRKYLRMGDKFHWNYNFKCDNQSYFFHQSKTYKWSTREKEIWIIFRCSQLFTQSWTSMTSSWVETFKGKILAEKVTHCYLNLGGYNTVTGRSCSNWFSNAIRSWWTSWFVQNREKKTKKQRGHFLGSSLLHQILKRNLYADSQTLKYYMTLGQAD